MAIRIQSIRELNLRSKSSLAQAGIRFLEDVTDDWTDERLLALKGFGTYSLQKLRALQTMHRMLEKHGGKQEVSKVLADVSGEWNGEAPRAIENSPVAGGSTSQDLRTRVALVMIEAYAAEQRFKIGPEAAEKAWLVADAFQAQHDKRFAAGV